MKRRLLVKLTDVVNVQPPYEQESLVERNSRMADASHQFLWSRGLLMTPCAVLSRSTVVSGRPGSSGLGQSLVSPLR